MSDEELFSVAVESVDGRVVVALRGEFDLAVADEAAEALRGAYGARDAVVVDLHDVTFMDSTGLRTLVVARRAAEEAGCDLRVGRCSEPVRKVLEVTSTLDWLSGR